MTITQPLAMQPSTLELN